MKNPRRGEGTKRRSSPQRGLRVLLVSLVVLAGVFVWLVGFAYQAPSSGAELSLDRVYRLAAAGQIVSAELLDEDAELTGERCVGVTAPIPEAAAGDSGDATVPRARCSGRVERFHASYPRSDVSTQELIERMTRAGARVVVDKQTPKAVAKLVVTFVLPLLLLANLFGLIFLLRGADSSLAEIAGFGRIGRKRQRQRRSTTGVTFANVAGAEEAVAELREVTDYLKDPKRFEAYGAAAPKGVLLYGPPGCGKTLLARAVAGESGVPFFSLSGAEFVESLVGVGAARVRDLFRQVREVAPAIVFIDEIDAVGRRRGGEGTSGGEREQTVNQLLVEMDGFEVTAGIVLMGATNRPDILDPALLRPGRFDRHVTMQAPDLHGRQAILELHGQSRPISADVDFEHLARRTPGFTGADLANVINEGALLAIRDGEGSAIQASHLSEAVLRVLHGPQRRGKLMTPAERKRLCFHESGHALVAAALGHAPDVHRVSIVARGRALAQSVIAEEAERVLLTRIEMEAQLAIAMGGIAAEELHFGDVSTTSEDDIDRATALAAEMVGRYGMSAEVGRIRLLTRDDGYLGGDGATLDRMWGQTSPVFDHEVKRLVTAAEQKASEVLTRHRVEMDRMAGALEEQETLEGDALERLLSAVAPEANLFEDEPVGGASRVRRSTSANSTKGATTS